MTAPTRRILVWCIAAGPGLVATAVSCGRRDTTGPAAVEAVTVAPASASYLQVGQTQQFGATPLATGGIALTGQAITWDSSNPAIAAVSANGLVTAVAPGTATVTATCAGRSGSATIIVQPPVAALVISQSSATLAAGVSLQLTATPEDANGNALQSLTITWTSSNTAVANVSSYTAITGRVAAVAAGMATITATTGGVSALATITVVSQQHTVAAVVIVPDSANFADSPQGFSPLPQVQMTALLADAGGNTLTGIPVAWFSSDTTAATVTANGLVTPNPNVATSSKVTIVATSEGVSATAAVIVNPTVAAIIITPSNPTIALGQQLELIATPLDVHGNPMTGVPLDWRNENAGQVRLTRTGDSVLVTTVGEGAATVIVSEIVNGAGPSDTLTITVTGSSLATLIPRGGVRQVVRANVRDTTSRIADSSGRSPVFNARLRRSAPASLAACCSLLRVRR
jgi:trimeric autotransporter adhesin